MDPRHCRARACPARSRCRRHCDRTDRKVEVARIRALMDERATHLNLLSIDVDGALEEMSSPLPSATRRTFLQGAVVGGAALLAELADAGTARASGIARTKRDISILRFDLVLEYLQAGLYTEAERLGALPEKTLAWARVVGAHERAHARAIKNLLGSKAVKSPSFDYPGVTESEIPFLKAAVAFEELTA